MRTITPVKPSIAHPKVLIIRFSSLGDLAQAMDVPAALKRWNPRAEIHWAVRDDFRKILETHPDIDAIWSLDRRSGLSGLWQLIKSLAQQRYSHIYDAHNNLRSHVLTLFLRSSHFVRRPKHRLRRWLYFRLRWQTLPTPFRGRVSFLSPLVAWGIDEKPRAVNLQLAPLGPKPKPYVTLAPSAAWAMKRWPLEHWKSLVALHPDQSFVVLGGSEDHFLETLTAPNVRVMAGQLALTESLRVVRDSVALVSNDTGLLHYADLMGVPCLGLIGPTAFGYPSGTRSVAAEIDLPCKPCSKDGRGICNNSVYQRCLVDLSPTQVSTLLTDLLSRGERP